MTDYIMTCTLIGVAATFGMTSFLWGITYFKICNVDMVKAIGSYYTQKEDKSLLPGMLAHFTAGIIFCFLYILLFNVKPTTGKDPYIYVIFGGGIGFVHGIVMALLLVIVIAAHHPLEKYRSAGFATGVYHFFAHIIYGVIIGTLYCLFILGKF